MFRITVPQIELFDEEKQEFVKSREFELQLEHSLVSLARWESKWKKPFLAKKELTTEETLDYIRCMTINQNMENYDYSMLPQSVLDKISDYIGDPMTATTFSNQKEKATNKEIVTAEIIYYWMITFGIPFECQKWHLGRLLTLINVCSIKNQPAKKMSAKDLQARNKALNMQRRAQLKSSG